VLHLLNKYKQNFSKQMDLVRSQFKIRQKLVNLTKELDSFPLHPEEKPHKQYFYWSPEVIKNLLTAVWSFHHI
jgi:hypothetical protein